MHTDDSIATLKGVGKSAAAQFRALGIETLGQLIDYLPRRYDDYSAIGTIQHLRPGPVSVRATISQIAGRYVRRGMHITEAIASDATGSVRLVWFNQAYRAASVKKGQEYYISGQYELRYQRFAITSPSIELVSDFPLNVARIVPIYSEKKGLSSKQIRRALHQTLPLISSLPETLPSWMTTGNNLPTYAEALRAVHFPDDPQQLAAAKRRLGFEEVFVLSLAALLNKYDFMQDTALPIPFNEDVAQRFVAGLPFALTDAQRKVVWQVYKDMQGAQPMNRIVEGDVGSGKTVVAAMAALMAIVAGYQAACMAPTEILARQHLQTFQKLLAPLGMHDSVVLLVGGMPKKETQAALQAIASGAGQFIVGTHALIQENVDMHKLGLVLVDEQHRFGVAQRKKLMAKAGHMPHMLSLTATPIPRSLALTLYGELDISVLDSKPAGRQVVRTKICSPNSRQQLYKAIEQELQQGRQMFVVCPYISEESDGQQASAQQIYARLHTQSFKQWRIGLLHGKMKPQEKTAVMEQFVRHHLDILVSTTVIEVGVDVPNASIMLIEGAERFGLSQIHQLRGRVGRGSHQAYCYVMMSDSSAPSKRLRAIEQVSHGFRLAEIDLALRGPGALYGTLQHGQLDLRIANLSDRALIAAARQAAQAFIEHSEDLVQYPQLAVRVAAARAVTNLH